MSEVPREPARFFGEYAPAELRRLEPSLAGFSSPGAVVFDVSGAGVWSLKIADGVTSVAPGMDPKPLVRISIAEADFAPILVAGAERFQGDAPDRKLVAARLLTVDEDRARLLSGAPGTLALKLTAERGTEHRLGLTLGTEPAKLDAPDCEIACALDDLWAIQSGAKNAFELLMDGKLKISGKVELAMALAAALG